VSLASHPIALVAVAIRVDQRPLRRVDALRAQTGEAGKKMEKGSCVYLAMFAASYVKLGAEDVRARGVGGCAVTSPPALHPTRLRPDSTFPLNPSNEWRVRLPHPGLPTHRHGEEEGGVGWDA